MRNFAMLALALVATASVVDQATATPADSVSLAKRSYGVGASDAALLFECTEFPWDRAKWGWYIGGGFYVSSQFTGNALHGGVASQSGVLSAGAGFGYSRKQIPLPSFPSIRVENTEVAPHGWLEIGSRIGPALRVQYGPAGPGLSAHLRFGRLKPR